MSQQIWNMDPRYLKHSLKAISFYSSFIVPIVIAFVVKLHSMYSILLRPNLKPCNSNYCLHRSNLTFTPSLISSTKIMSSANNMQHDTSPCIDLHYIHVLTRMPSCQCPPKYLSWYFVVCLFQVNKNHVQVSSSPIQLSLVSYDYFHCRSPWHKSKLVLWYESTSPHTFIYHSFP